MKGIGIDGRSLKSGQDQSISVQLEVAPFSIFEAPVRLQQWLC